MIGIDMMFLLLLLLVFLGLFIGLAVGSLAEEELKPGLPYFEWLRRILFIAIVAVFFIMNPSWLLILIVALIMIAFSFSREREAFYYSALSIVLYLTWVYNGFHIIAPLIFLYGFPTGTIYLFQHIKEKRIGIVLGLLAKHLAFLLIGLLFLFIELIL
jgi:hypothetical protein